MPASLSLRVGSLFRFWGIVNGHDNKAVVWAVNGINGGNATLGTIAADGHYQAPGQLPASNIVTITATSVANSSASGSATLTLMNPEVSVTTVEPAQINKNTPLSFKVFGNNFVNGARVTLNGNDLATTFISSTELRATGTATLPAPANVSLNVTNPEPGSTISGTQVGILPAVTVTTASTAQLRCGLTLQFGASVDFTDNKSVIWSVNGTTGGNQTVGTISATGFYTAPAVAPTSGPVSIKATSVADPTASATCIMTLMNRVVSVTSVEPGEINVNRPVFFKIYGSNFVSNSKVTLGGNPLVTTFVSSTELDASGAIGSLSPGVAQLIVTNPDPGSTISGAGVMILPNVSVNLTSVATLRGGTTKQLDLYVEHTSNKSVIWTVNGIEGGSTMVGTIAASGLYVAPVLIPNPGTVSIKATSVADPAASATCAVTLLNPIPVVTSVTPTVVNTGSFSVTINGSGFSQAAQIMFGSKPLATTWVSSTRLQGTGTAVPAIGGRMVMGVSNPNPGASSSNLLVVRVESANPVVSAQAAARFLEQASWGPDPESIARVQKIGFASYLDEQFDAPMSDYPEPPLSDEMQSLAPAQKRFFTNALLGKDQLRQRVAFALSQILVVSAVKTHTALSVVPYLRLLHSNAFGSYLNLIGQVTLSPTMGHFLDLANNYKAQPTLGTEPNENYARELLQLFTIGPVKLNRDGSTKIDAQGEPIPAYSQADIVNLSRALTGWTYPSKTGGAPTAPNPPHFEGEMGALPTQHDTSMKTFLDGFVLPAGNSAEQDLVEALIHICGHPNVAPFVARRLIQHLVTSNPSPSYVDRVASVFNSDSSGYRGNLRSVVKAILLDPEARQGDNSMQTSSTQGHLREPILFIIALLRATQATVPDEHPLAAFAEGIGQQLFYAPSVFNYFSPLHYIPDNGLVGPEYQIFTPSTALIRANFVNSLIVPNRSLGLPNQGPPAEIDLAPFIGLAESPDQLVEALNHALMHGHMSQAMKDIVKGTITPLSSNESRARTALYLVAASSQYQVQR